DTCGLCVDDSDCPDSVCVPAGLGTAASFCADKAIVLHATTTGTGTTPCSVTSPCSLGTAFAAVTGLLTTIKLDGGGTFQVQTHNVPSVTINARGATLDTTDSGPILSVSSNRTLTVIGGTITGATGSGGDGIMCNGATLNVYGTTIEQNAESAIDASNGCN